MHKYPHIAWVHLGYGDVKNDSHWSAISEMVYARSVGSTVTRVKHTSDAMVCRTRGRCVGTAMLTDADVIFFYDRDLSCDVGDTIECCRIAHERQAIVGGAYAKKRFGDGIASVFLSDGAYEFGHKDDELIPASHLAGGFMAIPRSCINKMAQKLDVDNGEIRELMYKAMSDGDLEGLIRLRDMSVARIRDEGDQGTLFFHNFFRPIEQPKVDGKGDYSYQPEDYAFNKRARFCGIELYVARRCNTTHVGDYGYRLVDSYIEV